MSFQFAKDAIASVYKMLSLTKYDLRNNKKKWISIIGLQILIVTLLNMHSFLPGSVEFFVIDFFDYIGSFELGLGEEYFSLILNLNSFFMIMKVIFVFMAESCLHILFPIVILQNALDLAFDSQMRGFKIKSSLFIYIFTIGHMIILRNVILDYSEILFEYYAVALKGSVLKSIMLSGVMFMIGCLYVYVFQRIRFIGLHILEYQSGVLQAIKASYAMTQGKVLFLLCISTIQVLVLFGIDLALYYITEFIIPIINKLIARIPINILSSSLFTFILNNLLIVSVMVISSCIMIWFYSIEAHVYRQLVSPLGEKSACDSCETGS